MLGTNKLDLIPSHCIPTDAGRETGLGDRCLGLCAVNRSQVRRVVVKDQGEFEGAINWVWNCKANHWNGIEWERGIQGLILAG